ncbi:hypothetical protein [Enterovibrio norvegicus]|uniref:hypothetical protein n=1 Tax=Enterovibrio norvegicus TaxID=188144 RepID=UPI0013044511|nr:hypothetical protein [Enterovibrio norvegicus]
MFFRLSRAARPHLLYIRNYPTTQLPNYPTTQLAKSGKARSMAEQFRLSGF